MGQRWPASEDPQVIIFAARATWAPSRSSAQGAPCRPCSTAVRISSWYCGRYSTSSMRCPYRSWVRSTGGCSLANLPHCCTASLLPSRPSARTSSSAQPAPSRCSDSISAGCVVMSCPASGGTWLVTSCVCGIACSDRAQGEGDDGRDRVGVGVCGSAGGATGERADQHLADRADEGGGDDRGVLRRQLAVGDAVGYRG